MSRHVIFGAGQIGTHVARQLLDSGNDVVVASRSGRNDTKFRNTFGDMSTHVWSAIEATVQWYRDNPAKEAS